MKCFQCDDGTLNPAEIEITGTRNGEDYAVRLEGLKCGSCGLGTLTNKQSAELTRLVSDEYRKAHGLLTGAEIRTRRTRFTMTQQEFAEYLGVGVASVKRWELGRIQDNAMDQLIRLKSEPDLARQNLRNLSGLVSESYTLSTAIVGGREIELSLLLAAGYYRPKSIELDCSELGPITGDLDDLGTLAA